MKQRSVQSRQQSFSHDAHPFSIAMLTSPSRKGSRDSNPQATPAAEAAQYVSSFAHPGKPPSTTSAASLLQFPGRSSVQVGGTSFNNLNASPGAPKRTAEEVIVSVADPRSPLSSTGSADCSPDTSFSSSLMESTAPSPEMFFLSEGSTTNGSRACSPAASEDSGRGSPAVNNRSQTQMDPVCSPPSSVETSPEKPPHSYIGLISMAILSSPEQKLVLSDIYQYIMDNFAYYNNQERAWRNSIRHNLSLNECFIKAGRADNGKGNFWAIHPACVDDFAKGDFRRRQARRRARATGSADHTNAALALQYVPMTSMPATSLHPYLSGALQGHAAAAAASRYTYLQAAYNTLYSSGMLAPQPPSTPVFPAATTGSDTATAPPTSVPGRQLLPAFGTLCRGPLARTFVPGAPMAGSPAASGPSVAGHSPYTAHASNVRYSPYSLPAQVFW